VTSIILGTLITVIWKQMQLHVPSLLPFHADLDAVYPALFFSLLSLIVVSLATPAPTAAQVLLKSGRT
jgi:SSS family solute:Na+ symporter/sodium/proline symporter